MPVDILAEMSEITQILEAARRGDPQAASQLFSLVYDELRKLAAQMLAHEKPGQTLDATALVHEAYPSVRETRYRKAPRQPGTLPFQFLGCVYQSPSINRTVYAPAP